MKNQEKATIYGIRAIIEAIQMGKTIDSIQVQNNAESVTLSELLGLAKFHEIPVKRVPLAALNRLFHGNHQGVVAWVSPVEYQNVEEIVVRCFEEGRNPLILVLDSITDVRNFGAIVRTAEGAGVDAVVIPAIGSVSITADSIKTSSGALLRLPVCRSKHLIRTLDFFRNSGLKIVAATEKAEKSIFDSELTGPLCVIMGSEDQGIQPLVLKAADELLAIPMNGDIESLNVSVATGIVLFEVLRQGKQG
jgi:23S rRNA (guanosine2251-2'-O)-methyltransferase